MFKHTPDPWIEDNPTNLKLDNGSHVAVIGSGPAGSFFSYLIDLAVDKGANLLRGRVDWVGLEGGRPQVKTRDGLPRSYDLLGVAVGLNISDLKLFEELGLGYKPPRIASAYLYRSE